MSILFDTLRFQNPTHEGRQGPIVAEAGVIVNTIPSEVTDEEGKHDFVDLPVNVRPGYYYITMVSRSKNVNGVNIDNLEKKYIVSDESIFEFIFGIADEEDPPQYIESYDRIEDAVNSDFLSFFLYLNKLIDDSRIDQTIINDQRRRSKLISNIETTVQIDQVDKFLIVSKAVINQTPFSELRCEIELNDEEGRGSAICINDKIHLHPHCCFKNSEGKKDTEKYLTLDRALDSENFSDYARLKKAATDYLVPYFEKKNTSLEERFTKEEIAALKTGILGVALGLKEYQ